MKKNKIVVLFVGPAIALLLLFSIIPIIVAVITSFTDMSLSGLANLSTVNFIGIENYSELLTDPEFKNVIQNTIYYVIIGIPMLMIISLAIALSINCITGKLSSVFRSVYYIPAITNTVAVAFVWMFIYNKSYGLLNFILINFGYESIGWLTDPQYAKFSLIILAVWRGIGINMIILLAAIVAVPKSYYEAASIDGANAIQRFFKITLPTIRYALFFILMTSMIGWMQFFDEPYLMIEGKLANTESISLFIYNQGFKIQEFGYASAASIVLFVIILIITIIQMRIRKRGDL